MTTSSQISSAASMGVPASSQNRLVIVGASGMVGGYALRYALDNPGVKRYVNWTQESWHRASEAETGSASELRKLFPLSNALSNQDAVVYCLGTYTGSVSDDQLRVITADYAIGFRPFILSGSRISTPWSRGRNRISTTE